MDLLSYLGTPPVKSEGLMKSRKQVSDKKKILILNRCRSMIRNHVETPLSWKLTAKIAGINVSVQSQIIFMPV